VQWESATYILFSRRLHVAPDHVTCIRRSEAMKGHTRWRTRSSMAPFGIVVLVAFHALFFNRLLQAGVSLAVVAGLALLAIAKHLGLLGSLYGLLRRRSRH
jgi:hypothetical protein